MATPRWPSEWMRGMLGLAVMRVLADGPTYGYALAETLENEGFGTIKGGTLYPLLTRLEAAGHLSTEWRTGDGGPGRKYFALTDDGRRLFLEQSDLWGRFCDETSTFITSRPATTDR